jgi:hypothetical protein
LHRHLPGPARPVSGTPDPEHDHAKVCRRSSRERAQPEAVRDAPAPALALARDLGSRAQLELLDELLFDEPELVG